MFKKVSRNDIKIISVCCLIFLGSFLILFFDVFNQQNTNSDQPVVGTTVQISNDVRLKAKQEFAWSKSAVKTAIRYGDQIFIGPQSKAVIQLLDGQTINIAENSLIRFDQKQNVKNFKIVFGSVKAKLKKDEVIEVTICGEKHFIKSETDDELTISNNENCVKPEFKFKKSKNTVQLKKKKSTELSNLAIALVEKSKPLPAEPLMAPNLSQPIIKMSNFEKSKKIQWDPVQFANRYVVNIFSKKQPLQVLNTIETAQTYFEFVPKSNENDYLYTVQALTDQKQFLPSATSNGEVNVQYVPIKIVNPIQSFVMKARTSDQAAKPLMYDIRWVKVPQAKYYQIEISTDEKFKKITSMSKASTNSYRAQLTDFGKQFYKVTAFSEARKALTESQTAGTVEYSKQFDLLAPKIPVSSNDVSLFFQKTEGQFIRLHWKNDQSALASKYYIEISTTEDFSQIFKKLSSDQTSIVLNEAIPQGQYYWRVKSYSDEVVSNWSDTARLNIRSQRNVASEKNKKINKNNSNQLHK